MLQTLKSWFKPQPAPPPRRLYDPYIDKVIAQAEQGAAMLGEALQYDWESSYREGLYYKMTQQPVPAHEVLHVPYYVVQEVLQNIFRNEDTTRKMFRSSTYWVSLQLLFRDSYQQNDMSKLTGRQQGMQREIYRLTGYSSFDYARHYYEYTLRDEIGQSAMLVMLWLQNHGLLQELINDFIQSFQQLFPHNREIVEIESISFNGTSMYYLRLKEFVPIVLRISIMATFFNLMKESKAYEDAPWEWTRAMYLDAFVDTCRSEQTIHKTLFRMFDIHKRYTHMA